MAKGFQAKADVLNQTVDGLDLNDLWGQFAELLGEWNTTRNTMIDLLSVSHTGLIAEVQMPGTEDFQEATEFGVPTKIRPATTYVQRALPFKFYDLGTGYTWQYLMKAPASQVQAVANMALEADNRLQFNLIMKALFGNVNRTADVNGSPYTVAALYNADGAIPPTWENQTFAGSHNHYVTSGAATLDPQDVLDLARTVEHHGFTETAGYNIIVFIHPDQADTVRSWRRGVTAANSVVSLYDFVPPEGSSFLLPVGWDLASGSQPGRQFGGMDVVGKWGQYLFVQSYSIPTGYMLAAATAGRNSQLNLIGVREHENAAARGLILKPGNNANYPLIESYYIRGMGAGVLQRGAAALMQITAAGSYTIPPVYA